MIEYALLKDWSAAAGLHREGSLIDFSLRVRTDQQKQLLRTVFDNIEAIGPVLARWEQGGTVTHGMAEFSAAWKHRPPVFEAGGVPARPLGFPPTHRDFAEEVRDGRLSVDRDALYLLMQCQVPQGSDTPAHLNLRAWVFLKGLQLAIRGTTADRYLADACHALRRAAYELPGSPWRQALEPLGAWTRTHEDLTEHIQSSPKYTNADGERARHIRRFAAFADGKERAIPEATDPSETRLEFSWITENPHLEPEGSDERTERLEARGPDVALGPRQEWGELPDDAGDDTVAVGVDPEASPFSQALHVRAARLQLGAAARFLRWDWAQLSPPEFQHFERLVSDSLSSPPDERTRLLAALAWVASEAGLTLDEALQLPIEPLHVKFRNPEWRIALNTGLMKRRAPRRADHRKPTSDQEDFLRSAASRIDLPIRPDALEALRSARRRQPAAQLLGQLWDESSQIVSSAFRRWVKGSRRTHRLQPAMLGRLLGQRTYDATRDHVLARLLPSTPDSALPASTVYTAFHESDVRRVWPDAIAAPVTVGAVVDQNVAGSLMELSGDPFIADGFRKAHTGISQLRADCNWIGFHNAVALYWDAALRAATAVRPVNDLWLTPDDIDWEQQFLFVDDKASPVSDSGRLVPLPPLLCEAFKTRYLEQHLPWVLGRLADEGYLDGIATPLLFVVEYSRGKRRPVAISNQWRSTTGIESPLPLNVFRHRLRTLLHAMPDVDKEVVDSVLGHGDGATLTHGDNSMRVWTQDAAAIRPAMARIYEKLAIEPPPLWDADQAPPGRRPVTLSVDRKRFIQPQSRSTHSFRSARSALRIIRDHLAGVDYESSGAAQPDGTPQAPTPTNSGSVLRRLAQLSSDQLDKLSVRLLVRDDGLPDTMGAARYEFLLRLAEIAWKREGLRLPIRRRYSVRELEPSSFRREAPGAVSTLVRMRTALDAMFDAAPVPSRMTLGLGLCLLLFDLCLTSRITNPDLLDSLLENKDGWRVVCMEDRFYLEWSPEADLQTERDAACMRFPISLRSAWLLTGVVGQKTRRREAWTRASPHARQLAAAFLDGGEEAKWEHSHACESLLVRVRAIVDQCNIIELPGTVAGFLAGRVWTASLGWGEWLQVRQGRWIDTSAIALSVTEAIADHPESEEVSRVRDRYANLDDEEESDPMDWSPETRLIRTNQTRAAPSERNSAAVALVRKVQREIRRLGETKGLTKRRKERATQLSRHIHDNAAQISSTIQLLCLWAIDMLIRPGRSRKLATSSVYRYFVALSPRMLAIGCDIELDSMDDEQIESFYADVMDIAHVKQLRDVHIGLRNFHRFAHHVAGLPEIDWSALATSQKRIFGAPGFVDESTYVQLLEHLENDETFPAARSWQLQGFLIFCYRFGLRAGETAGLTRSDVVWDEECPYVLVRRNRLRALKTSAARRIVPLLFALSPVESRALQRLRDSHLPAPGGSDTELPIFSCPDRLDATVDDLAVRAYLNAMLKQFTGQPGASLHDLRHSFAAHVWAATQSCGWAVLGKAAPAQRHEGVIAALLGPAGPQVSRRTPWALARLLGHAHPGTALRSYVHSVSDALDLWVDTRTSERHARIDVKSVRCVRPGEAPTFARSAVDKVAVPPLARDPSAALIALRYMAAGRTDEQVAQYTRMSMTTVGELRQASTALFESLASSPRSRLAKHLDEDPGSARLAHQGFLAFVRASAFTRLRKGLAGLAGEVGDELARIEPITLEHWVAMIGERREISLWEQNQFALFALAVRHLTADSRSIELQIPVRKGAGTLAEGRLQHLARSTGWLPATSNQPLLADMAPALCQFFTTTSSAPAVRLPESGHRVDRRVVLLFSNTSRGLDGTRGAERDVNRPPRRRRPAPGNWVYDRLELLVCALCMNFSGKHPI